MAATRRIAKELADLQADPVSGCSAAPQSDADLLHWVGTIDGPKGTPYEGGHWKLDITFPREYPFKAPTVKFMTRIYHMNITDEGLLCIGLLKAEAWKPSAKIAQVMAALVQLLMEPNTDDALVASISEKYQNDRAGHDAEAKAATKRVRAANQSDRERDSE